MNGPYFTPGTWKYSPDLDAIIVVRKHRLVPVADFGKIARMEQDANATVMAASKDLYSSLKDCLDLIDKLMPGVKHIALQNYKQLNDVPLQARQLIAHIEKGGQ